MTSPGDYNANVVLTANVSQYQQAMGAAQQTTDAAAGSVDKLLGSYGRLKEATRTKFISWDKEAAVTLSASVAAAGLFEKQLSTLSATAAVTGKSMNGFRDAINGAFAKLPVARGDLTALATQLNQLGVTAPQDIGKLLDVFTKLSAVTGAAPGELASTMLQFTQSMGDTSVGNVKAMSDQLVSLSKNAGVSALSVSSFANAIAPLARVAGISETQVLRLSTAFSKAGADGYVAGNTFNSIVADITQLAASGSPQLAKYANSLGMTTDQFKKLPAATAVAKLFEQVNKEGAAGINTLNQWGINGVRAINAVQQVAQSGQLTQLLNQSTPGANGSLDRGAKAAMGGLADALAETRNQFTMYGTYLGQHVIGPMTSLVHVVNSAVKALGLLKPVMAPVLAVAGFGGQLLGGMASLASPLLMAAWVGRGPIGKNLRAGFNIGRAIPGEASMVQRERYAAAGVLARDAETGEIAARPEGALSRAAFAAGMTGGRYGQRAVFGESGESQRGLIFRNALLRTPGAAARALMRSQETYLQNASNPAGFAAPAAERAAAVVGNTLAFVPASARATVNRVRGMFEATGTAQAELTQQRAYEHASRIRADLTERGVAPATQVERAAMLAGSQNPMVRDRAVALVGRSMVQGGGVQAGANAEEKALLNLATLQNKAGETVNSLTVKLARLVKQVEEANTTEGKANSTLNTLNKEIMSTVEAMGKLAATTATTSARVLGQAGGAVISRGASAFASNFKNIASSLFNPWVLMTAAPMLIKPIIDRVNAKREEATDTTGKYLNPIQQYNQQLGIATTNLVSLGNAATNAAAALNNNGVTLTSSTPMSQVATVSQSDRIAAARQGSSKDDAITGLGKQHSVSGLKSYAQSLDMSDPRQVQQFKLNALAAGFSSGDVNQAITAGTSGGPMNLNALATSAMRSEGQGSLAFNPSKRGSEMLDAATTKVLNDFTKNQTQYGTPYAAQMSLQQYAGLASAAGGQISGYTAPPSHQYGGGRQGFESGQGSTPQDNTNQANIIRRRALANSLAGQFGGSADTYFNALATRDLSKMSAQQREQFIIDHVLPSTKEGHELVKTIRGAGGTTKVADFGKVDRFLRTGGLTDQTQAALRAQGPLGAFALTSSAVQASAQTPQDPGKFNTAMKALADQALEVGKNFSGGVDALEKVKAGIQDSTNATYQAADAAQQWLQTLQQSRMATQSRAQQGAELSRNLTLAAGELAKGAPDAGAKYQAAQGALNDWGNSQTQWMIGLKQTAQQFGIQMERSNYTERLQVSRANHDFGVQMGYQQHDFQQQRLRSYADFNKQIRRMAEDEAKSAYNPFLRVQSQYTTDAATLEQNLQDQNIRLEQQQQQLAQARRLGLSKQSIQQLQLADPNNAQQLNNIVQTLAADPRLAAQINRSIATRVHATTRLATSQYSQTFQRTVEDFHTQLDRTTHDYNQARERAVIAQQQSMDRMAEDYHRMVNQSAEDLNNSMKELYGSFADSYGGALGAINKYVQQYAPQAAATMRRNLKVLDPYLKLFGTDNQLTSQGTDAGMQNISFTPGTTGLNTKGQIGHYDTSGKWHPYKGYMDPAQEHVLPQVRNPITGHATGGVSTVEHTARISEGNKAETIIPLDERGLSFMTSFYRAVARELVLTMGTATHPGQVSGYRQPTTVNNDFSTQFTGEIKVVANNTKQLLSELEQKQRLAKLARPTRK